MVFLSPPPALGVFRLTSALPVSVVGNAWSVASALMTVAPPALPFDVAALLGAALVNSNAWIWGQRSGQLCALTAFMLILALLARQQHRLYRAGAFLAIAAFKPATVLAFL